MHGSLPVIILAIVLIASIAASAAPAYKAPAEKGFLSRTVTVGGKDMKYVVYIPDSYDPKKPMPSIIFLNGAGECGTDGWRQVYHFGGAIKLAADKWPFIVMFPQKQDVKSAWQDEEPMVMEILRKTRAEFNVDDSRLYLTGLSQGGHGTWNIAARNPGMFAAIAPICGWASEEVAKKVAGLPIWTFHGDKDEAVKLECSENMKKWIEAAGGQCKLTVYEGVGHNSWDNAYRNEDLGAWFLEHRK